MRNWTKAAFLSAGLIGALAAGACANEYYDDGYGHRGYYRDSNGYYGRDHRDRDWDDRSNRVRVCDADGDDCHYEYERH